jgi:hypothetical protein
MSKLTLTRFAYTPMGTFGSMDVDGLTLYTVERQWLNNAPSISCIPEGTYKCVPSLYIRNNYDAIEVTGVPKRTRILMHIGNTQNDSAGCILINSALGWVNGMWAGTGSKNAFNYLMERYNKEFTLDIKQYKPRQSQLNKFSV